MPDTITNPIQMLSGDSALIDRLVTRLTYSGIDAKKAYDDEDNTYALLVNDEDRRRASRLLQSYLQEEKTRKEAEERKASENESAPYAHIYENCEERYQNHFSSAITFAAVGLGLLAAVLLAQLGVLPLSITLETNPLAFLVFTGAGILFEVIAVISFHRANQLKLQIADEKQLTSSLTDWFITTYDKQQIDRCICAVEGAIQEEEILYLKRLDQISCYLTRENDHLDPAYAAKLAEDLYELIYND